APRRRGLTGRRRRIRRMAAARKKPRSAERKPKTAKRTSPAGRSGRWADREAALAARRARGPVAAALAKIRPACLALPGTEEKVAWGSPTFRVDGRLFVMFLDNHHGDGRLAIWCNAAPGAQEAFVAADPKRYFIPPYVGPAGWLGVRLDRGLVSADVV